MDVHDLEPITGTSFVQELQYYKWPASVVSAYIKAGASIIPAYRDPMAFVYPRRTAQVKSNIEVLPKCHWSVIDRTYYEFSFIIFKSHPHGHGWQHGFFVNNRDVMFTT